MWTLVLLACGGGGLGPEEGAPLIRWVVSDDQPVVSTRGDWATYLNDVNVLEGYEYSRVSLGRVWSDAASATAGTSIDAPASEFPAFDDAGRLVYVLDGRLEVTDSVGLPYARVDVGATSSPAIGPDGTFYLGTESGLLALSADGETLWTVDVRGRPYGRVALGDDGTAFVVAGTDAGFEMYAARDGELVWTAPIATPTSWPALGADGSVLLGTFTGANPDAPAPEELFLSAWDASSGDVLWEHAAGGIVSAPIAWPDGRIGAVVTGVTGGSDPEVGGPEWSGTDWMLALDEGGDEEWKSAFDEPLHPAVLDDDGRAWLACGGDICVLSDRGREIERFTVWDFPVTGAPVLWDGWILVTLEGWLYGIQLPDRSVTTATSGWPREGGNARGSGRRADL